MIIYTEKFCDLLDLKTFAFNTNASLHDLQQFLESKTLGKYTVVEKAFLKELYELIDYSNHFSIRISQQLNNVCEELLENNKRVKMKWSKHINLFEL